MGLTTRPVCVPDGLPDNYPLTLHLYGVCPECGRTRKPTNERRLPRHRGPGEAQCRGVGRTPARVALSTGYTLLADFPFPEGEPPRDGMIQCPKCSRYVAPRKDGLIRRHRDPDGRIVPGTMFTTQTCMGSYTDPATGEHPPPTGAEGLCERCKVMVPLGPDGRLTIHQSHNPGSGVCPRSLMAPRHRMYGGEW